MIRAKKAVLIFLAALGFAATAAGPVTVQLFWSPQTGIDAFVLRGTNDITAPLPWPVITTFFGISTNASISMFPATMNFYLTASNFWGESGPSNVGSTPAPATNVANVKLTR